MHYASCLSKRHILAFLEDNPDFQKVNFFGIPPQDDWNKYKTNFVREIIATEKKVREQDEQKHKDEATADSATEWLIPKLREQDFINKSTKMR